MEWNEGWIQVLAIIGGIGGPMIWMINKLDTDIKGLSSRMDKFDARMDGHARRIDQLYQMFVDLLKQQRRPHQ